MAYSLTEIRTRTRRDPAAFLAECDEAYQARIRHAAGVIVQRMEKSPIVLLSGPSGSGKTTSALKLEEELERRGVNTHTVSLDNYFHAPSHPAAPRTPEGDIDFESPRMLDMALLDETFTRLSQGEEVTIPRFEFSRQMRNDAKGWPLRLRDNEVAIFEGIHALNDDIAGRHPEATALYVSARSDVLEDGAVRFKGTWMRITRRAVRDCNFRGTDLTDTLSMWHNVRRGRSGISPPTRAGPTSWWTPLCPMRRRSLPTTPRPWPGLWRACPGAIPAGKSSTTCWTPSAGLNPSTPSWSRPAP